MSEKQHVTCFLILLIGCVISMVIFEPPTRSYVPFVWGLIGFGLHGFLFWKTWIDLSSLLILKYQDRLDQDSVSYQVTQFKKTVNMFDLFLKRKALEPISADIKNRLSYYRTFFRLTLVAFLMFPVMGVLMVVLTW